jgi:hypothetical protein
MKSIIGLDAYITNLPASGTYSLTLPPICCAMDTHSFAIVLTGLTPRILFR